MMPAHDPLESAPRGVSSLGAPTRPVTQVTPVSAATRRVMQSNKGRDTTPELQIRSLLHRAGLRFRVDHPLPFDRRRRADITFTRVHLFVFVDGCFWHGCPIHYVSPKTRASFWRTKLATNIARDLDSTTRLGESGATVLRFWEHDDPHDAAEIIVTTYRGLIAPCSSHSHRE